MKISLQHYNSSRVNNKPNDTVRFGRNVAFIRDNINFRGDVAKAASNAAQTASQTVRFVVNKNTVTCKNAHAFIDQMDKIFGDGTKKGVGFFTENLKAIGVKVDDSSNIIQIPKRTFFKDDFLRTVSFPVRDFLPWATQKIDGFFNTKISTTEWIKGLIDKKNKDHARDWILDNIEEFSKRQYDKDINLAQRAESYRDVISSNISKVKKNYSSRDERTLNRIVTSIVSAIYSAADFHNISMLEKDDKKEAKKAAKGRMKQDLTRMAFNATTTFIALGMLDRYTKRNVFANSLVIALSALIAEISSRLISKTPLRPLSPQEAAEYAKKMKVHEAKKETKQEQTKDSANIQFKASYKNAPEVFAGFMKDNKASFKPEEISSETPQNTDETPKSQNKFLKILAFALGSASALYFVTKGLKGDYSYLKAQKQFIEKHPTYESVNAEEIKKLYNNYTSRADRFSLPTRLKNFLTYKEVNVNLDELEKHIKKLQRSSKGSEIKDLLENLLQNIDNCKKKDSIAPGGILKGKTERFIISGVVEGVTKIWKTLYSVFTIPAKLLDSAICTLTGAKNAQAKFGNYMKKINENDPKKHIGELVELNNLFKKVDTEEAKYDDIVEILKKRTRNVETSAEIGELANTSRMMVVAIGTYFFVNDYRNKVLIESEGKNIQGAQEEMNERIWHKVFNFIINGTLMNIFNTVFKKPFNASLIGASSVAAATEVTNEFLVRKSICQPVLPKASREDIIEFENKQINKKGPWGAWSRLFKRITGKKSLTEKTGINSENNKK